MIYKIRRWLIRRLVPKCDICGKPAYFEHYDDGSWFYVCWDCSMEYKGQGKIW